MPYVVTEDCIKCKYMDCVETCPVDCFYEGENMLVINPAECIDCAACETVCPVVAIISDDDAHAGKWSEINRKYSAIWPRIVKMGTPPPDARQWEQVPDKFERHFSAKPGSSQIETKEPGVVG